jgi:hypothetical protein
MSSNQSSKHYIVKSANNYSKDEIKKMLEFLIDNIFVIIGDQVFQQSVGIPIDINCAPLLTNLLIFIYMRKDLFEASK